jgi:predicted P-loop ATPase
MFKELAKKEKHKEQKITWKNKRKATQNLEQQHNRWIRRFHVSHEIGGQKEEDKEEEARGI